MVSVRAELSGEDFDLTALVRLFSAGDPTVHKHGDAYFLESERLEGLATDGSALHKEAARILTILNGTGRADSTNFRLVSLTGKYTVEGIDGLTGHTVVALGTVEVRSQVLGAVTVIGRDGVEVPAPPPKPTRIAALATTNSDVEEVLRLLAEPEQDWGVLYKIYEVVRDAVGGRKQTIVRAGYMTAQEQSAFTASANRPDASGSGARHARMPGGPATVTMTLLQGREFIRRVVNDWVGSLD